MLDVLEARYPGPKGTIQGAPTKERRPLLRFFACELELTHHPADEPLPEKVANGSEPYVILGAIAGG